MYVYVAHRTSFHRTCIVHVCYVYSHVCILDGVNVLLRVHNTEQSTQTIKQDIRHTDTGTIV